MKEMRFIGLLAAGCLLWSSGTVSPAFGQRGVGDRVGVARQATKPEVVTLSGTVKSVESGPCEQTTGRALVGTHLMLLDDEGTTLNIHLGPRSVLEDVVARLKVDEELMLQAFRTEKMSEGHYVAQSLELGGETVVLRDDDLRPVWAGDWKRGLGYQRRGDGRGGDQAPGVGEPVPCPRWGGPPRGSGAGWSRSTGGRGRGYGMGRGAGRGFGRGRGRW